MDIVCVADQHGYLLDNIPSCDLLIVAGDICPTHDHDIKFQQLWIEGNFIPWAQETPAKEVVWIAGNHDFTLQDDNSFLNRFDQYEGVHYLEDQQIIVGKYKIWGTPWSNKFGNWAFMGDENFLAYRAAKIPDDVDIVISHNPMYGFCDRVVLGSDAGQYKGSTSLRHRIKEINPELFVCGHIHEGRGMRHYQNTTIVNASIKNEYYEVVGDPIVVEL